MCSMSFKYITPVTNPDLFYYCNPLTLLVNKIDVACAKAYHYLCIPKAGSFNDKSLPMGIFSPLSHISYIVILAILEITPLTAIGDSSNITSGFLKTLHSRSDHSHVSPVNVGLSTSKHPEQPFEILHGDSHILHKL